MKTNYKNSIIQSHNRFRYGLFGNEKRTYRNSIQSIVHYKSQTLIE